MDQLNNNGLEIVRLSLVSVWNSVLSFLPELIAALVVFIIGWVIAVLAAKVAWRIVKAIQLDKALESIGIRKAWERTGYKLNSAMFFYELVKWFFIVVFLSAATNILGLEQVTGILIDVVKYIPQVFIAAIVLIIGVLVARFLEGVVRGSVKAAEIGSASLLANVTKWVILIFAISIALDTLDIGRFISQTVIVGVTYGLALAIGLAFGLGGKDHAKEILSRIHKDSE